MTRDGGLDAASGSFSPWRRLGSHWRLRPRLCQPSTRWVRPDTSQSVPSAGLTDTSAPRLSAMSRPVVILCAYLARQVTRRWQEAKLPAREVRGSSIPRLGHAELDAAQKRRRRRRMKKWRRTLTCEQQCLRVVDFAEPGARISTMPLSAAAGGQGSRGLRKPRNRHGLSATLRVQHLNLMNLFSNRAGFGVVTLGAE